MQCSDCAALLHRSASSALSTVFLFVGCPCGSGAFVVGTLRISQWQAQVAQLSKCLFMFLSSSECICHSPAQPRLRHCISCSSGHRVPSLALRPLLQPLLQLTYVHPVHGNIRNINIKVLSASRRLFLLGPTRACRRQGAL